MHPLVGHLRLSCQLSSDTPQYVLSLLLVSHSRRTFPLLGRNNHEIYVRPMQAQVSCMTSVHLNLSIRNALLDDISDHLYEMVLVRLEIL
jgi:hypothetical protein